MAEYLPIPQPEEVTQREREDGMGAYLMMFAAWAAGLPLPMLNVLASVIYYYVNRQKGNFVRFHALQSMWSQILVGVLNASVFAWGIQIWVSGRFSGKFFWPYLIMVIIANILYFIFSIIAAVRAKKGRFFYFIFFGKMAYQIAYSVDSSFNKKPDYVNRPPV